MHELLWTPNNLVPKISESRAASDGGLRIGIVRKLEAGIFFFLSTQIITMLHEPAGNILKFETETVISDWMPVNCCDVADAFSLNRHECKQSIACDAKDEHSSPLLSFCLTYTKYDSNLI